MHKAGGSVIGEEACSLVAGDGDAELCLLPPLVPAGHAGVLHSAPLDAWPQDPWGREGGGGARFRGSLRKGVFLVIVEKTE